MGASRTSVLALKRATRALNLVGVAMLGAAVSAAGASAEKRVQVRGAEAATEPVIILIAQEKKMMQRVIVTLSGLTGGPAAAADIRAAQERVIALLQKSGETFEINRRYDLIPQLALTVSEGGIRALRGSPDVESVKEDGVSGTF
jgi:hypothetical protein